MNILVLGGTGVLSTDIVKKCADEGNDVYIVTRGSNKIPSNPRIHSIIGNARKLEAIWDQITTVEYDVVIDFLSVSKCNIEYSYSRLANICNQFVFISSACVFRRAPEDGVLTENSPKPNALLDYSVHKLECEEYIRSIHKNYKCKFTIVRPYITYGDTRIPVGVAPLAKYHWTIIGRILSGKSFFVWNEGENKCTLMHTKDFAHNFFQLLMNENAFDEDFNIVGDEVHTWSEVIELLYKVCDKQPNYLKVPIHDLCKSMPDYKGYIVGDRSLDAVFDNSKLKAVIPDFQQRISLHDGLTTTIDYYMKNNYLSGIDFRYDGDIDRLISINSTRIQNKLGFVDYIDNATLFDKIDYYSHRYLSRKLTRYTDRIINRLKRI